MKIPNASLLFFLAEGCDYFNPPKPTPVGDGQCSVFEKKNGKLSEYTCPSDEAADRLINLLGLKGYRKEILCHVNPNGTMTGEVWKLIPSV